MKNKIKYNLLPASIRRQWSFNEYLRHHMQDKSVKEISDFLSYEELTAIEKKLNKDEYRHIFNSKSEFYKYFGKYLKREAYAISDMTETEFFDFVKTHEKVVIKPDNMYAGIGISVIYSSLLEKASQPGCNKFPKERILSINGNIVDSIDLLSYKELADKKYVIEDYVNQSSEYSSFHPYSLNTVRVTTLIDDLGTPHIIFAANQFGSNQSIVDNNDDTAIWAGIDLNTGLIDSVDIRDSDGFVFDKHPDSKKEFIGFRNPCFDEIKEIALEAATVVPECRLIGWDIAVREDNEVLIIEGNVTPELDLYQVISGKGLKPVFTNFIKSI